MNSLWLGASYLGHVKHLQQGENNMVAVTGKRMGQNNSQAGDILAKGKSLFADISLLLIASQAIIVDFFHTP